MIKSGTTSQVFIVAVLVLLLLFAGRGYVASWDFTYFFVGGTDFVNSMATPAPVWVQNGQGYDGQFFYKYSIDPFDFSKTNYGVTVDLVQYRMQRIVYPLLVWVFSFGGKPHLVPLVMVLVNLLAFLGIIFYAQKLSRLISLKNQLAYTPLLLCGIYMSLARSLSEVTELCFFMCALYYLFKKDYLKYVLLGSVTILTRETALIALVPLALVTLLNIRKGGQLRVVHLGLFIPVVVFGAWKWIVLLNTGTQTMVTGSGNLGWPVLGIIDGFIVNIDFSSTKNIMQLIFYTGYFLWQLWLLILVLKTIKHKWSTGLSHFETSLSVTYLSWLIFAIFLSSAIYVDDWSFMRVFGLWNMIGFILISAGMQKLPRFFVSYSAVLVALTVIRLIIRP